MRGLHEAAACSVALALGACQTAQLKPQDIDLARGCWVQKSAGSGEYAFLRILPGRTDPDVLEGAVHEEPAQKPRRGFAFTLNRDGSSASWGVEAPGMRRENGVLVSAKTSDALSGGRALAWGRQGQIAPRLMVEGDGDRLKLWNVVGGRHLLIRELVFDGERDGCD